MIIDDFRPAKKTGTPPPPTPSQAPIEETPKQTEADDSSPAKDVSPSPIPSVEPTPPLSQAASSVTKPAEHKVNPDAPVKKYWGLSKKTWLWITVIIIIIIGGGGFAWAATHKTKPTPVVKLQVNKPKQVAATTPTTVPSDLDGLPVSPALNKVPVTGVMIENSTFARPQSGLSEAGVVFEAIAEGGITRFLALYQDMSPTNVGPIRSVRPYYEQWALGFDAAIAHVGGSPEALADIKTWNVRNLDQFYNGSYYHRITTRVAPHNVYTSIGLLNQLEASKGYTSSTYTSFPRKQAAPAKTPTASIIHLTLSSSTYDVEYTYNPATNSYSRDEGGAPQIDANTNTQLSPKVVIAMVMPYSLEADGYHSDYGTIGSGPVYVFQDGTVTTGTWAKSSNTSQFTFTRANGSVIKLNPGQTWLTAVAASNDVSYTT